MHANPGYCIERGEGVIQKQQLGLAHGHGTMPPVALRHRRAWPGRLAADPPAPLQSGPAPRESWHLNLARKRQSSHELPVMQILREDGVEDC